MSAFDPSQADTVKRGGKRAADTCLGLALVVADLGAEHLQAFPNEGC